MAEVKKDRKISGQLKGGEKMELATFIVLLVHLFLNVSILIKLFKMSEK